MSEIIFHCNSSERLYLSDISDNKTRFLAINFDKISPRSQHYCRTHVSGEIKYSICKWWKSYCQKIDLVRYF